MSCISAFLFSVGIAAAKHPNVILIVTDDQSPVAGCYGNPVIKTPNLDALAKEGVRFTRAFASDLWAAATWQAQWEKGRTPSIGTAA